MPVLVLILPRLWNLLFLVAGADLVSRALHLALPRLEGQIGGFRGILESIESAGPFLDRCLLLTAALLLVLMLPALLVRDRPQRLIGGMVAIAGLVFLGLEAASILRPWPLPQTIASSLVGFLALALAALFLLGCRSRPRLILSFGLLVASALPALWRLLVRIEDAGSETALRSGLRLSIEWAIPIALTLVGFAAGPPRTARKELIPVVPALLAGIWAHSSTESVAQLIRELSAMWISQPAPWSLSLMVTAATWGLVRCIAFDADRRRAAAAALLAIAGFRSQSPAAVTSTFVALILLELSRRRGPERLIPVG